MSWADRINPDVRWLGGPVMIGGPYDGQMAPPRWPPEELLTVVDPDPRPVEYVDGGVISAVGAMPRTGLYVLGLYHDGNLQMPAYRWEGWQ